MAEKVPGNFEKWKNTKMVLGILVLGNIGPW
jgi:hypothetical protein